MTERADLIVLELLVLAAVVAVALIIRHILMPGPIDCKKNERCLSAFPTFVPSLSWQIARFDIKVEKNCLFSCLIAWPG